MPVGLPEKVGFQGVLVGLEGEGWGDAVDEGVRKDDPVGWCGDCVPEGDSVDQPPVEEGVEDTLPPFTVRVGEELDVSVEFQGVRLGLAVVVIVRVGWGVGVTGVESVAEKETEEESLERGLVALLDTLGEKDGEEEWEEWGADPLAPMLKVLLFVTHMVGVALPPVE